MRNFKNSKREREELSEQIWFAEQTMHAFKNNPTDRLVDVNVVLKELHLTSEKALELMRQ